jgi:hypothetical protein
VVIAIVAVILLGCITVIVYWKVQNSKENVDNSPPNSAAPFAKCSSTQLTDVRENTSVQSFVLNEVRSHNCLIFSTSKNVSQQIQKQFGLVWLRKPCYQGNATW